MPLQHTCTHKVESALVASVWICLPMLPVFVEVLFRYAKVGEPSSIGFVRTAGRHSNQDIIRFDVAVDEAALVQNFDLVEYLKSYLGH